MLLREIGQLERDDSLPPPPWSAILTSGPVLALNLTGILAAWGFFVAMIDLPKYMSAVLHVNAHENGIYSSMPYVAYIIISLLASYCSDRLIASDTISTTNARKLCEIICKFPLSKYKFRKCLLWIELFAFYSVDDRGLIRIGCLLCWMWSDGCRALFNDCRGCSGHANVWRIHKCCGLKPELFRYAVWPV